jgi:hypothetical protein
VVFFQWAGSRHKHLKCLKNCDKNAINGHSIIDRREKTTRSLGPVRNLLALKNRPYPFFIAYD